MIKPDTRHGFQWAGATYAHRDGYSMFAVEYGILTDVLRDNACNYSYREFWF